MWVEVLEAVDINVPGACSSPASSSPTPQRQPRPASFSATRPSFPATPSGSEPRPAHSRSRGGADARRHRVAALQDAGTDPRPHGERSAAPCRRCSRGGPRPARQWPSEGPEGAVAGRWAGPRRDGAPGRGEAPLTATSGRPGVTPTAAPEGQGVCRDGRNRSARGHEEPARGTTRHPPPGHGPPSRNGSPRHPWRITARPGPPGSGPGGASGPPSAGSPRRTCPSPGW